MLNANIQSIIQTLNTSMLAQFDTEVHLLEITLPNDHQFHLIVSNTFTHSRSIYENSYFEVCQLAEVQLHLVTKHYIETVLQEPFWRVKEIAMLPYAPHGEALYSEEIIENLKVLIFRDPKGRPVIAGGLEKSEFIEEFIREGDELDGDFSETREEVRDLPIEAYTATHIPTTAFREVFDMNRYFNWCTRYDYKNSAWVKPSDSNYTT